MIEAVEEIESILVDIYSYDPFSLALNLERNLKAGCRLVLSSDESVSFPGSDVRSLRVRSDGSVEINFSFSGFYGVGSSLPHYFIDDSAYDSNFSNILRGFLDIFNSAYYSLEYKIWKKGFFHDFISDEISLMSCILEKSLPPQKLSSTYCRKYPGISLSSTISKSDLESFFLSVVPSSDLRIDYSGIKQVKLATKKNLGAGLSLGQDSVLGDTIFVKGHSIDVFLGELPSELVREIEPSGALAKDINEFLAVSLPVFYSWRISFVEKIIQSDSRLGSSGISLGRPFVLGQLKDEKMFFSYSCQQYSNGRV